MKQLFIIPIFSALLIACGPDVQAPSAGATSAIAASDSGAETNAAEPADARTKTAETAPREAPQLKAALEGQTRAPLPESSENWTVETVAEGLEHPWALDFLPDGSMLVTERPAGCAMSAPTARFPTRSTACPKLMPAARAGCMTWPWPPTSSPAA